MEKERKIENTSLFLIIPKLIQLSLQTKICLNFFLCYSDPGQGSRLSRVSLVPAQSNDTLHRALLCLQGASDTRVHPQKVKAGSTESNLPFVQVQQG